MCIILPLGSALTGTGMNPQILCKLLICIDLQEGCPFGVLREVLAGEVLPYAVRKEAALDLHSPFSTSHSQPIRLADRSFASPFLTFPTLYLF
jgi:hypothetical protein